MLRQERQAFDCAWEFLKPPTPLVKSRIRLTIPRYHGRSFRPVTDRNRDTRAPRIHWQCSRRAQRFRALAGNATDPIEEDLIVFLTLFKKSARITSQRAFLGLWPFPAPRRRSATASPCTSGCQESGRSQTNRRAEELTSGSKVHHLGARSASPSDLWNRPLRLMDQASCMMDHAFDRNDEGGCLMDPPFSMMDGSGSSIAILCRSKQWIFLSDGSTCHSQGSIPPNSPGTLRVERIDLPVWWIDLSDLSTPFFDPWSPARRLEDRALRLAAPYRRPAGGSSEQPNGSGPG